MQNGAGLLLEILHFLSFFLFSETSSFFFLFPLRQSWRNCDDRAAFRPQPRVVLRLSPPPSSSSSVSFFYHLLRSSAACPVRACPCVASLPGRRPMYAFRSVLKRRADLVPAAAATPTHHSCAHVRQAATPPCKEEEEEAIDDGGTPPQLTDDAAG